MAWQDRPYYRGNSSGAGNPLSWLLSGSMPLFTAFGIRVRAHASMVILIALTLIMSGARGGLGIWNAMTGSTILFGIILLHEFGHCFAARSVGGEANDILMWPLGGLAYADAPRRAWPQLWTAIGGPLVNVAICILTGLGLAAVNWSAGHVGIPWNPLSRDFFVPYNSTVGYYLWWTFIISWSNLLFNVLPIFPLDGGRILQASLWHWLGQYKSTLIACGVGMVGAALMAMYGLANFGSWYGGVLLFIGISCFMTCMSTRMATKAAGPWEEEDGGIDYSAAYDINAGRSKKPRRARWSARRAARRARKIAAEERSERQRIDAILAKVSAHGMHSLSWLEKRALRRATEHQRQRDAEMSEISKL
jgi:Zn-dependent protease